MRRGAHAGGKPRLYELNMVIGTVDLANRQAEEGDRDDEVAAQFLGGFEGEVEEVAGDDFGQHDDRDDDDADLADHHAAALHPGGLRMKRGFQFLTGKLGVLVGFHGQRPTAARISFRMETASALCFDAHSSQYGLSLAVASLISAGSAGVSTIPSLPNWAVT